MKSLLHFTPLFLLAGCLQTDINYVARVKLLKLSDADIYKSSRVEDVLFDAEEQNIDSIRDLSRQLFLQGMDAFRNKKTPGAAISLFKKSILILPDAKSYYELGNALLETAASKKTFEEAGEAFYVAQELHFQPISLLLYKKACVSNNIEDEYKSTVLYTLEEAFANGFSDTNMVKNDKHLKTFIVTDEYKNLKRKIAVNAMKGQGVSMFTIYSKSFPELPEVFEIKPEMVAMSDYKQSISYDFVKFIPEMQNSTFGRDVSHDFMYVGRLAETPFYTGVIYTSVNYYGELMQPAHVKLVTYDTTGAIISTLLVAGQFSPEKIRSLKIENNKLMLEDIKRVWEKPIDKVPFEENQVTAYESLAKAVYRIDAQGKIIEESVPDNFNDSLLVKN